MGGLGFRVMGGNFDPDCHKRTFETKCQTLNPPKASSPGSLGVESFGLRQLTERPKPNFCADRTYDPAFKP